jgi:hypothetical protein
VVTGHRSHGPSRIRLAPFDSCRFGSKVPPFSHAIRSCRESSLDVPDRS